MSHAEPVGTKRSLFPSTWIVGTAAAELARNDPDVLLPGDPVPQDQCVQDPPVATRSAADEIAALHAENERLHQRFVDARGHVEHMAQQVAVMNGYSATADAPMRPTRGGAGNRPAPRVAHRGFIALLLLVLIGSVASAWLALQPIDTRVELLRQLRTLTQEWRLGAVDLGRTLRSEVALLPERVGRLAHGVESLWTSVVAGQVQKVAAGAPGQLLPASTLEPAGATGGVLRDRLAPDGWWALQGDDRYTIHVVGGRKEPDVARLLTGVALDEPLGLLKTRGGGEAIYGLVVGSFASHVEARAYLATLPPALQRQRPSVRRIGDIRDLLL